jgi:signal transduction histidine kinase
VTDMRSPKLARPRRRFDLLLGAGLALGAAVFAIFAWVVVVGPPANDLTIAHPAPDAWVVASVAIGGPVWNAGVRPGMEVIGVGPAGADPAVTWDSLLVTDGTVRIAISRLPLPPSGDLAILSGLALLLAAVAAFRLPNVAWLLALGSLSVTTLNVTLLFDPPINAALLLAGPVAGALYASDRRRRLHPRVAVLAGAVVALVLAAWGVAYLGRLEDWRTLPWLSVLAMAGMTSLGVAGVVHAAWRRAHARQHASSLTTGTSLALLADELVPGRARTRLSAIERERARLADDLHADVLPDLAAVIREIEAGAAPEDAARRLRGIAAELRDLMSERRLAVLEELGLVRALEWLAERVQERTGVPVELDIAGASHDDPETRPPHEVELAVYRVAQQALDNALLHAGPRTVRLRVDVDATHVALELGDDGVGMPAGAEDRALREGHLGLADMRQRAESIGAAFSIGPRPGGGTLVAVRWPG